MKFTDIFVKRPVLASAISLAIVLLGMRAWLGMTVRQYPNVTTTVVTITTADPGASPETVKAFITSPLEQAVEEYNRTGTRRLNIEDPNLLKVHISGIFPADDPGNMIKFLQRRFAVVVEETPEAIRLSSATHN